MVMFHRGCSGPGDHLSVADGTIGHLLHVPVLLNPSTPQSRCHTVRAEPGRLASTGYGAPGLGRARTDNPSS